MITQVKKPTDYPERPRVVAKQLVLVLPMQAAFQAQGGRANLGEHGICSSLSGCCLRQIQFKQWRTDSTRLGGRLQREAGAVAEGLRFAQMLAALH